MSDKILIEMSSDEIMNLKYDMDKILSKETYKFVYDNRNPDTKEVPSLSSALVHMKETYSGLVKLSDCFKLKLDQNYGNVEFFDECIIRFYYACLSQIAYKERLPPHERVHPIWRPNERSIEELDL